MGVYVGVGVLGLAVLGQDAGHHLVDGVHDLEQRIVGQVLHSELALALVARISLAQHSVAVAGDHLAGLQGLPCEGSDGLLVHLLTFSDELSLQLLDPGQYLLVGQAVQRTGQSVQTSGDGQVGIGQSGAHQVSGVGRGIATLVIGVDHQVQTHQLVEVGGVIPKHSVELGRVIQLAGSVLLDHTVLESAAVDQGSNLRELRNYI